MLIDWFTFIAQIINFLILVYLLKRFLYRPILDAIDKREKRIATQLQEAAAQKQDAEEQHHKYQKLNEELNNNKESLMAQAKTEAEKEHQRLLEEARQNYDGLRSRLQESLKKEQSSLSQNIRQQAQTEIFGIARKVLADLADTSLESQMVQVFIQKLESMNKKEKAQLSSTLLPAKGVLMVRSAFELNTEERKKMKTALEKYLGKKVEPEFHISPEELGGIELSGNGFKLAWNIRDYLDDLEKRVAGLSEEMQGTQS
jgi:F-type H+-transporting ATPase subunit b